MMQAALLTAVAYFLCYAGNWMFGQCMTERPLVVGPIVGLFLGDPVTGLMLGATLEAIYMGAVNIGGSISSEPATATAFAVAFAVTSGISQDAAVGLAILMKMLWSKELAVYYLLGFVLVIYFGIPLVALAAIGAIIVVITAMRDIEIKNLQKSGVANASQENDTDDVEGFLS